MKDAIKITTNNGLVIDAWFVQEYTGLAIYFAQDRLVMVDGDLHEIGSLDILPFVAETTNAYFERLAEIDPS